METTSQDYIVQSKTSKQQHSFCGKRLQVSLVLPFNHCRSLERLASEILQVFSSLKPLEWVDQLADTYVANERRHFDTCPIALILNHASSSFNPAAALCHDIPLAGTRVVFASACRC
jgi:hypothetical protein